MSEQQIAFQIHLADNVATALGDLEPGVVVLRGDTQETAELRAVEHIAVGHKIALRDMRDGEDIIKYGIVIGRATRPIVRGSWIHLHCMCSLYDERSGHLDVFTGTPADIRYE